MKLRNNANAESGLFRRLDPRPLPPLPLALDQLGGQESQLERLLGVEARVAVGVVAVVQVGVARARARRRCIR